MVKKLMSAGHKRSVIMKILPQVREGGGQYFHSLFSSRQLTEEREHEEQGQRAALPELQPGGLVRDALCIFALQIGTLAASVLGPRSLDMCMWNGAIVPTTVLWLV